MTSAKLAVTLPQQVWISEISRSYPDMRFRVLSAVPGDRGGYAIVRIAGEQVEDALEDMQERTDLTEITVLDQTEDQATVHFRTTAPLLLFSSKESGMPIELPVEIASGEATVTVTGSRERLSEFGKQLLNFGLEYKIEYIHRDAIGDDILSDRQEHVLTTALEEGYYESPRDSSLTELAEELDIAKSTLSETLRRAEGQVIDSFLADKL